jgi:hypothetical protein
MNAKDYPEVCRTCDHLVANPHFDKAWLSPPAPADDSPDQPPR